MTVGYAAFQTNLDIKGTSKVSSNWNVLITNVTESNKEGQAETVGSPTWTDLTAYMEANLYQKGDSIEYDVTVENRGTIDASLDNVSENIKSTNEAIKITFSGYTKGEKLYKNETKTIKVKIEYNPEFNGTAEEGSSEVSIDLNYTQSEGGGTITPTDKYLVTYDCVTNGGNNCSSYNEYLNERDTVNLNHTATKEGFKFLGWSTNKDATNATQVLTELNMLNEDITLYAIFKDVTPPECEITITEAAIDGVSIKANCTDASGIKEYNFINESTNNIQTENTYNINKYKLSKITVQVTDKVNNKGAYKISEDNLQKGYQIIMKALNEKYDDINTRNKKYEEEFLNKTYPVGSIYITESNINPSTSIGGTWETYGAGKTLVGVDTENTNFNTVNKTGGTSTSTLATTNMPAHTHSIPALSGTAASAGAHTHSVLIYHDQSGYSQTIPAYSHYLLWGTTASYTNTALSNRHTMQGMTTTNSGAHTHAVTTTKNTSGSTGSGTSFTNLQPYITVYLWKRIN